MTMPVLIGLPYSPWSERARWALELCRVEYLFERYQPLLGELRLRRLTKRWRGPATVPVLVTGDEVLTDSFEIARYADAYGVGQRLFIEGREDEIAKWNALSERGLSAGRARSLVRMLADRNALNEMVPRGLRKLPGGLATRIAAMGVARTLRKYGGLQSPRTELEAVLDEVRAALGQERGDEKYLLGSFSYADMAIAQVLAFVSPPSTGLRIGEASRGAFTDPSLAERYADLLAWRDALYSRWRKILATP